MDEYDSQNVELYIYDLTRGMASMMSQMLLGIYYVSFSNAFGFL